MVTRRPNPPAWLGGGLIVGAGLWVFWPALRGAPLWDDNQEVFGNAALRSWAGFGSIWTGQSGPDYFPLKSTIEWVQWHLWHDRVSGYHVTSLVCHLGSALLFWALLGRLFGRRSWAAWLGALLFAIHPLATESVAWVAELKNTLSLPLLLLAAGAYLDSEGPDGRSNRSNPPLGTTESPRLPLGDTGTPGLNRRAYAAALGWFAASLLCKTSGVMFPGALLLYAYWRRGRLQRADWLRTGPFFALSLLLGIVTLWFQTHRAIADLSIDLGGPFSRLAAAGSALWRYWLMCLSPAGHRAIFPRDSTGIPPLWIALSSAVLAVAAGLALKRRNWLRGCCLGLGWFFLNLLPVAGLVPMSFLRIAPVADHFLYVSALGVFGLLAAAVEFGAARPPLRWAGFGLGLCYALFAAAQTRDYSRSFLTAESYWRRAAAGNPRSWLALNNLGSSLLRREDAAAALGPLREAHRLNPAAAEVTANLCSALLQTGAVAEAVAAGNAAVQAEPGFATGQYNFANALIAAGRKREAIERYRTAAKLEPASVEFHYNLANALAETGDLAAAASEFEAAAQIEPDNFAVQFNLGNVLAAQDRLAEATRAFRAAARIRPDSADAHYCLGDALAAANQTREAASEYHAALRLRPGDAAVEAALKRVE